MVRIKLSIRIFHKYLSENHPGLAKLDIGGAGGFGGQRSSKNPAV